MQLTTVPGVEQNQMSNSMNDNVLTIEEARQQGYEQAMREFWSYDEGQEPTCVVPGIKYGIYGEMIPCCRSVEAMLHILDNATVFIKPASEILDEERAQRGPDGTPLRRVTPMVPYLTKSEWDARNSSNH